MASQRFVLTGARHYNPGEGKQAGYLVFGIDQGVTLSGENKTGFTSFGHEAVTLWLPIAKVGLFSHTPAPDHYGVYELEIAMGLRRGSRPEVVGATWVGDLHQNPRKRSETPLEIAK